MLVKIACVAARCCLPTHPTLASQRRWAGVFSGLTLWLCLLVTPVHADWELQRTLTGNEVVVLLFPVNDQIIWVLTRKGGSMVYYTHRTQDGGKTWQRRRILGLRRHVSVNDDRIDQLIALDGNTALVTGTVSFTGKGPGVVYRTEDGGVTWHEVFSQPGNCQFQIGMADRQHGLMAVHASFLHRPGQQGLYATSDGGVTWTTTGVVQPAPHAFITAMFLKRQQVWLQAGTHLYYSENLGASWSAEVIPRQAVRAGGFHRLHMANRTFGIANSGPLISLFVKRPVGDGGWQPLDPQLPRPGAVSTLLLVGHECWFSMPLDDLKNYYSDDHCTSFAPFVVAPESAFFVLRKAWRGRSLWGATQKKVYVQRREL